MYSATETSNGLVVNPFSERTIFNPPINRDFRRPDQIPLVNAQILPNDSSQCSSSPKDTRLTGTTDIELKQLMKRHKEFQGWITTKELEENLRYGGHLVELETNSPDWLHCCGLKVSPTGLEYFDPMGLAPPVSNPECFDYNVVQVQDNQNNTCGPHTCHYLSKIFENYSMRDIVKLYPSEHGGSLQDNDAYINNYYNREREKWLKWRGQQP